MSFRFLLDVLKIKGLPGAGIAPGSPFDWRVADGRKIRGGGEGGNLGQVIEGIGLKFISKS
jgi:hypothetical protein